MGFLAKSGLDSLKIAGHKVPIGLVAAGVGLAGVIVVLRARQGGQQVGSVGQGPATAADSGFGLPLPATDPGAQLANISQQLTSLGQALNPPGGTPAVAPIGSQPGEDAGFFFGAPPAVIPTGKQLVWRYTSKFAASNPNLPGVNSNLGLGYGPGAGTPGSQYAYSWEWALI